MTDNGEVCVMITGMITMLKLSAGTNQLRYAKIGQNLRIPGVGRLVESKS